MFSKYPEFTNALLSNEGNGLIKVLKSKNVCLCMYATIRFWAIKIFTIKDNIILQTIQHFTNKASFIKQKFNVIENKIKRSIYKYFF